MGINGEIMTYTLHISDYIASRIFKRQKIQKKIPMPAASNIYFETFQNCDKAEA